MKYSRDLVNAPFWLILSIVAIGLIGASMAPGERSIGSASASTPVIEGPSGVAEEGDPITVRSTGGGDLLVSIGAEDPARAGTEFRSGISPDHAAASRILAIPLAMQWRHPKAGLPAAQIVKAAEIDPLGRIGPQKVRTFLFHDHGDLPVISLVADHNALFSADSGIMVVGDYYLRAEEKGSRSYQRDPRWWKYPGNFMGRGKEWQRDGHLEFFDRDGQPATSAEVGVRINGQMTRGFPQHALRLLFNSPFDPWNEGIAGYRSMVLRAAGNDQIKAMMRDAFQQELCADLPFEVSKAWPTVLYINGAYWGVHHLRERIDDDELARRYSIPAKQITILEDAVALYKGDPQQVQEFTRLLAQVENGSMDMDRSRGAMDVDGFLAYMASQMILGNMDWPEQNVKYWRFTGEKGEGVRDGRWYFIMGDSDLSFGANASPETDPFIRVRNSSAPIARLFRAMMRDPVIRQAFVRKMDQLIEGELSTARMLEGIDRMVALIGPEMDRHTARWRKPADRAAWEREVQVMREFAKRRATVVKDRSASIGNIFVQEQ